MSRHVEAANEAVTAAALKLPKSPSVGQALALAQVHATLALVEAQQLANTIETARAGTSFLDEADLEKVKTPGSIVRQERMNALRARIKKGLGLT